MDVDVSKNANAVDPIHINLSLRPSPADSRDWIASTIYSASQATPPTLDLRPVLQPIRQQGNEGACTAFAACVMKEYQEYCEHRLYEYMSCQFLYNLRPTYPASGMYLRDAMKILQSRGVCTEKLFPYQESVSDLVTETASNQAENFKIANYARVDTIVDLKKAVYKNGPCLIAFPVYNYTSEFWKKEDGGFEKGGHAVAVVGYDESSFILRNSWGKGWASDGYTHYNFADWGVHWEVWTSVDDSSRILTDVVYKTPGHQDEKDKTNASKGHRCNCM